MILVFGETGQVASALHGRDNVQTLSREVADFTQPEACAALISAHKPSAVINAAAYTAVDKAEEEEALATQINATTPGLLAEACASADIPFVHISTDYVFDGSGETPWRPEDTTAPCGAYGRSKRAGEVAVQNAGGTYAILRTSWVYSSTGGNFLKTMLRLGAEREELRVVSDQIGGPTPAPDIAEACLSIAQALKADPGRSGLYHFSGQDDVSWAGFAKAIMEKAGLACRITEIPSSEYPTPAKRPANSRLDCTSLTTAFGIERPDWRATLPDTIARVQKG